MPEPSLSSATTWLGGAARADDRAVRFAVRALHEGSLIGRVEVPRLGLAAIMFEGTTAKHVRPGRRPFDWLGDSRRRSENVVLAAHRDTFFRLLRKTRVGDEIVLTNPSGPLLVLWSSLRKS